MIILIDPEKIGTLQLAECLADFVAVIRARAILARFLLERIPGMLKEAADLAFLLHSA